MRFEPAISHLEVERAYNCRVQGLFEARQTDNMRVDTISRDCGEFFWKIAWSMFKSG